MIAIVDFGLGNVGAVLNMVRRFTPEVAVTADPGMIRAAERLILPGVGAFDAGMASLKERGLVPVLEEAALGRKVPFLGICLGLQLLAETSEEGSLPGLGWLRARVRRFDASRLSPGLRVPHMGWNFVRERPGAGEPLLAATARTPRFYFAHSFHLDCTRPEEVAGLTEHGYEFPSVVRSGNLAGVQFHPEKSHRYGLELMARFVGQGAGARS
jgi:glutamine amidotransferase